MLCLKLLQYQGILMFKILEAFGIQLIYVFDFTSDFCNVLLSCEVLAFLIQIRRKKGSPKQGCNARRDQQKECINHVFAKLHS